MLYENLMMNLYEIVILLCVKIMHNLYTFSNILFFNIIPVNINFVMSSCDLTYKCQITNIFLNCMHMQINGLTSQKHVSKYVRHWYISNMKHRKRFENRYTSMYIITVTSFKSNECIQNLLARLPMQDCIQRLLYNSI